MADFEDVAATNSKIFYDGFQTLNPIARLLSVGVDQINFVVCVFIGYAIANATRTIKMSRQQKALLTSTVGIIFCYFCYGKAMFHLFINAFGSYAIMHFSSPKHVHFFVFIFSMSFLLLIHTYRFFYQKSYCLDVTTSIMISVGKVTLLASSLHDGLGRKHEESKITKEQKAGAITQIPSLLDFVSFMFSYQTILSGPMNTYSSWSDYLDDKHVKQHPKTGHVPDPADVAWKKFQIALGFFALQAILNMLIPISSLYTAEHNSRHILVWYFYFLLLSPLCRIPYYGAWISADAICNASGYGFSGFSDKGDAQWTLCTNVIPSKIEFGLTYKDIADNWNSQTVMWLRRVVYDRAPKEHKKLAVYTTSAVWHGVHVGYYFAFGTGYLCTLASASGRRCLRHHFTKDEKTKKFYDVLTFIAARFASSLCVYSFIAMTLEGTLAGYWKMMFVPHLVALFLIYGLPLLAPPLKGDTTTSSIKTSRSSVRTDGSTQKSQRSQMSVRTAKLG